MERPRNELKTAPHVYARCVTHLRAPCREGEHKCWKMHPPDYTRRFSARLVALTGLVAFLLAGYYALWAPRRDSLVVYCAHDSIYADSILREFERKTGIPVVVRYDTEATKSLGLVELLLQEKAHPRCDVFWNNELLGTLQLADAGLLLPYRGSGYNRIPAAFRDPDGCWAGFAARLRLWVVETNHVAATEEAIRQATQGCLDRMVIAKPIYGTTRTQYTILWSLWGRDKLLAWHRDRRARHLRVVDGNAMVKDLVSGGVCDLGWTDTDDYFEARDEGKPVGMLPVRLENRKTICIPNTVAIIRGTRHLDKAQKLVDFLLSEECELALARSKSRQIPLGPVESDRLPEDVKQLQRWAADGVPLGGLGAASAQCLAWLKSDYLQ
jgi:iron(III) transport system substrate-binding protein